MIPWEHDAKQQLKDERWSLLEQINMLTDKPMTALSFVWLGLPILDFTQGLSPLQTVTSTAIRRPESFWTTAITYRRG